MTRRRSPSIPQRKPVYIGCEGESEISYAGFLQDLIHEAGLSIHLVVEKLGPGAGDPLARMERARQRLARLSKTRILPADRFVLLDFDQAARDPIRAAAAQCIAAQMRIVIVWQRPCLEAMLLRHMAGQATRRPSDSRGAERALVAEWPEYRKPMTRAHLARRLDLAAVRRAATVEPDLGKLLTCLKLI